MHLMAVTKHVWAEHGSDHRIVASATNVRWRRAGSGSNRFIAERSRAGACDRCHWRKRFVVRLWKVSVNLPMLRIMSTMATAKVSMCTLEGQWELAWNSNSLRLTSSTNKRISRQNSQREHSNYWHEITVTVRKHSDQFNLRSALKKRNSWYMNSSVMYGWWKSNYILQVLNTVCSCTT